MIFYLLKKEEYLIASIRCYLMTDATIFLTIDHVSVLQTYKSKKIKYIEFSFLFKKKNIHKRKSTKSM